MAALGATALPLLVIQHPLGGEPPAGVDRRAVEAIEQLAGLLGGHARQAARRGADGP